MPLIPPVPAHRDPSQARLRAEVLGFPARYLSELPVKLRIHVQCVGFPREIQLCTGFVHARRGAVMFDGSELRALVLGVEAERLFPGDVKGYCLHKLHDPAFELTEELALGGVEPLADPGWSLGRVLRSLDLELRSIELDEGSCAVELDARAA